ncbi:hypothetical protein CC86DRAFT_403423 [Ophiobolus disseminans]|uniref:Uncharacterized protein n=1 Tax=Ophiobolus disseminans TaxID=1469910 RepID=A0A6A7A9Z4_9PLEO|nr:hypothetical protein CC86DRAFT_403423 [Ophiobolus disseminans]
MDLDRNRSHIATTVSEDAVTPQPSTQRAEKLWQRKRRRGKERARSHRFPQYAPGGRSPLPTILEEEDQSTFGDDHVKLGNTCPTGEQHQHQRVPTDVRNLSLKNEKKDTSIHMNGKVSGTGTLPELRKHHDELQACIEKAKRSIDARRKQDAARKEQKEQKDRERHQAEVMSAVSGKMDRLRMADGSRAPDETEMQRP